MSQRHEGALVICLKKVRAWSVSINDAQELSSPGLCLNIHLQTLVQVK